MNKFYVYTTTKPDGVHSEFIEDVDMFAAQEFDPRTMEFSGVMIEADSFEAALETYTRPTSSCGQYMIADEPQATVLKRRIASVSTGLVSASNEVLRKLETYRNFQLVKLATLKMIEANKIVKDIAKRLHESSQFEDHTLTEQDIYAKLIVPLVNNAFKFNGQ